MLEMIIKFNLLQKDAIPFYLGGVNDKKQM
ncbi:hypothetical protein K151_1088 [Proteus hauseri ZMd44]|nr:hypothetical protein K151_1088 [Proteus hauseri ZMd44]